MRREFILKLYAILPGCWLWAHLTFGQASTLDSVQMTAPIREIKSLSSSADSLYESKLSKLDSLESRLNKENILTRSNQRVDSVQAVFRERSDSLKNVYKNKIGKLDSSQAFLTKKLDSLTTLRLSANGVTQKLDRLNSFRQKTVADFEKKLQSIKDQSSSKLRKMDLPPEVSDKVSAVTKNIEGVNIHTLNTNPFGKVGEMGTLDLNARNPLQESSLTQQIDGLKMPGHGTGQLTDAQGSISEVSKATGQAGECTREAEQLATGNLDEA
jgi:hypothetical protein